MIRFAHPWYLLLLSAIPLIGMAWSWLAARSARRLALLASPAMQTRLMPPRPRFVFNLQLALALTALCLLTLAVARPQWGRRVERMVTRSRNVVIALDVSRSMLATDVHPNRLERARVDIMDLIADLAGDRAALLVFRRRGVLLCPLTTDYTFLRQALDGASPDSAPRGETDLADGIRKALEALEPAFDQHNAILLISDGEDLAEQALNAARDAAKRGVPIFTVGIGDPTGAPIPGEDGKGNLHYRGAQVVTRLKEETLAAIARESGGQYIPLATAGTAQTTLGAIYRRHVRQVAAREQQETQEDRYMERYAWFLFPSIILLLTAACFSRGRLSGARRRGAQDAADAPAPLLQGTPPPLPQARTIAALLLLASAACSAQTNDIARADSRADDSTAAVTNAPPEAAWPPGHAGARAAQAVYRKGRYAEAAERFLAASRGVDPEESQKYRFNAAAARIKAGDHIGAASLLQPLVTAPGVGGRAADLLAAAAWELARLAASTNNAIARLQALEQAGGGAQQAVRAAPETPRLQRNLARVMPLLPSAREDAHIAEVLEQHGQAQPDALLDRMFREQRALVNEAPAAFTNEAPVMIQQAEALAARQDASADLWIPLKQKILEAPQFTNAQQRAAFQQSVESSRDLMRDAARRFRDLDASGIQAAARGERFAYELWRQLAAPPGLLDEDIALQSNALARAATPVFPARADQNEAHALTQFFRQRFPDWADQLAQQAQADTNAPSLTPEARAEIEQLAEEAEGVQAEALKATDGGDRRTYQQHALKNLLRIRELLPKQSSQSPQQQPQPQPNNSDQQQPQPPENEPKQEEKQETSEPKQEAPPKDVQELLRRALQREKEHEAEKRRQLRDMPMAPDERDY